MNLWVKGIVEIGIDYDIEILDNDFGKNSYKNYIIGGEDYIKFEYLNR